MGKSINKYVLYINSGSRHSDTGNLLLADNNGGAVGILLDLGNNDWPKDKFSYHIHQL